MRTVLLFNAPREFYRDVIVSQDEIYCSPAVLQNTNRTWRSPQGEYDVPAFLRTLPEPFRDPELLLCHFDVMRNITPRNLAPIKCPKVLVIGDTHHLTAGLRNPVNYALSEPWDLVIGEFNRHHLHFFIEAGLPRVGWIPCFTLRPFPEFANSPKTRGATFVGQAGQWHPVRRLILQNLLSQGIPIQHMQGPQRDTALAHAQSRVNLNISLNGDLNLRNFEVLAVGGFLLTDELTPESGLPLLFTPGQHLVTYASPDDLRAKLHHYLQNPAEADAIAAAGHAHYLAHHTPAHKIAALHALLQNHPQPPLNPPLDPRSSLPPDPLPLLTPRLLAYETIQELHRTNPQLTALVWPACDRLTTDLVDLPRLRLHSLGQPSPNSAITILNLSPRIPIITQEYLPISRFNLALLTTADLDSPQLHGLLHRRSLDLLLLPDFDNGHSSPALPRVESFIQQFSLRAVSTSPLMLTLQPKPAPPAPN